jgi:CzcA family heavy metal efflux pump
MRWIVASSLRFRFLVVGLAAALMFFGAQTLGHQKVDVFPEFAPVSVEIQTSCLGLSPSEVESLVTVPLEAALQGVPGVSEIRSQSVPQLSAIYLYFRSGTNVLEARQRVQERLQTTAPTLPTWAEPPQLYPIVSATSRIMQIGLTSKQISPLDLSAVAQWTIRARLLKVPGVANVAIWGEKQKQVQVQANPPLMKAHQVSLSELMAATADAFDNGELKFVSGAAVGTLGYVETPSQRLTVRSIQPIDTPQQLAQVPLARRGGQTLRVGDLAGVRYGNPPLIGDAVIDGGPGLMMVVEKFPGANTLQVTAGVDQALKALQPGLPGVQIDSHIFRQEAFINTAIHNLGFAVILGCIFVVFVLIAFLFQWRAAFVSLLAIPLSLAAAGIVLDVTGATINTMILAGFAVAVGVVVDDAIIDMENIVRRLRAWRAQGKRMTPLRLVLAASLEVRVAIFYATLINIVAVIPVVLVGGLTGAFFRPLAIAYGLAVVASMAVALTVTPALGMILLARAPLAPRDPPLIRVLKRAYGALLSRVIRAPALAYLAVALAVLAGLLILPRLGQDLFPTFKEQDFLMHYVTKPGTSVDEQRRQVTQLQHELLAIPGVRHVGTHIGQARLGEEVAGVNFSENWMSLAPQADYSKTLAAVRAVANSHPGVFSDVQTYLHERVDEVLTGATEDLIVRIFGPDLNVLHKLAERVTQRLAGVRGLVDLHPEAIEDVPEADVQVRLSVAQRYGVKPGDVRRAAAVMMASEPVAEITRGGKLYPVAVWSVPAARRDLADLRALPIDTPSGARVPLGTLASIQVRPTPSSILHQNGSRRIEVDANVSGRDLGSVTADVNDALAKTKLPLGYHAQLLGEAAERGAAQSRLIDYGIGAAVVIFFLLQAAFQRWRLALLMFLTLPMALVGGVLAVWGVGTITLGALVGFFTVLGIAARNGILMIAHFQHLERDEGEPFGPRLVLRGALERLSPILMTATATALALAPLVIYGDRPGQEIENPMAIVILGGLATSTLLNLFVVPLLYLRFGGPQGAQHGAGGSENGLVKAWRARDGKPTKLPLPLTVPREGAWKGSGPV